MTEKIRPTQKAFNLVNALFDVVEETVAASGGQGCPSGPLYAAMMSHGITFESYSVMLAVMRRRRLIAGGTSVLLRGPLSIVKGDAVTIDGNRDGVVVERDDSMADGFRVRVVDLGVESAERTRLRRK